MGNPFLSAAVFVSPSLNRIRVVELPGPQFPVYLRGLSGFDLLCANSLRAMINARAAELRLQANLPNPLCAFDNCFNSPSKSVRKTAQQIAEDYGRRLGILLLTLKRAEPVNRLARPSWGEQHWAFWHNITAVHVGGGLLSGAIGPVATASAQKTLTDCGFNETSVQLFPYSTHLPLIGLARTAPPNTRAMLFFDFGQTDIKRAIAIYESEKGSKLNLLSTIQTGIRPDSTTMSEQALAEAGVEKIVKVVAQSWLETVGSGWRLDPIIGLSLACYLVNGHPPPLEMGFYGRLQLLTANLQEFLATRISKVVGRNVRIFLAHDGSAAALTYAGSPRTVAIMLGTAIGVGFPPDSDQGLRETSVSVGSVNML